MLLTNTGQNIFCLSSKREVTNKRVTEIHSYSYVIYQTQSFERYWQELFQVLPHIFVLSLISFYYHLLFKGNMTTLEAIRYIQKEKRLEILDQLLLPDRTEYIEISDTKQGWQAIKTMQVI